MSFLLKLQSFKDGALETINKFYEDIESAKAELENAVADIVKIYDHDGQLIHSTEEEIVTEVDKVKEEIESIKSKKTKAEKAVVDVPVEVKAEVDKVVTEVEEKL